MTESIYVGKPNNLDPLTGWAGSILINNKEQFKILNFELSETEFIAKRIICKVSTTNVLNYSIDKQVNIVLEKPDFYNLKTNLDIPYPLDTLTLSGVQFTECSQPSILPGRRMMIAGYLKGTYKGISYT